MSAPTDEASRSYKRQYTADFLALAVVAALPWSLSATLFLIAFWLISALASLRWRDIGREAAAPAGAFAICLTLLGLAGMLWADISWPERIGGADSFLKLLAIPLLLAQFRHSPQTGWLLLAFLASCTLFLIYFLALALWPALHLSGAGQPSIFVKSATTETSLFIIASFVLAFIAIDSLRAKRRPAATGLFALAAAFLAAIFYVLVVPTYWFIYPLETALPIAALTLLLVYEKFGLRAALALFLAGAAACGLFYFASPAIRAHVSPDQLLGISRPVFWSKSLGFIREAPITGHGTGSIGSLFAQAARGQTGPMAQITTNPYQETLFIGIQLGIIGIVALWAMWISHIRLFRPSSLASWVGKIVVISAMIYAAFDAELFDARRGWIYVFGIGIAGGAILRTRKSSGLN